MRGTFRKTRTTYPRLTQNFERAEFEQFIPTRLNRWVNRLEEYISGRDLSAEMQVELGSVSSLVNSLVDEDAERDRSLC
jgi:hypothetical protein